MMGHFDLLKCPQKMKGLCFRAGVLFVFGNCLAIIVKLLQTDGKIVKVWLEKIDVASILLSPWWIPPIVGLFATLSGLLYPWIDSSLGIRLSRAGDWSSMVRCLTCFIGLNHASTKFHLFASNNDQLFAILCILGVVMWHEFDGSKNGLVFGIAAAVLGTLITYIITHPTQLAEAFYGYSWLPCLYFAAACTFGNAGRILAKMDESRRDHLD